MMAVPEPSVRVTGYLVCAVPESVPGADLWAVTVEPRIEGWAVRRGRHRTLGSDGTWLWGYRWRDADTDPASDEEWDEYHAGYMWWLGEHRFGEETALALAKKAALAITATGWSVERLPAQAGCLAGQGPISHDHAARGPQGAARAYGTAFEPKE